MDTFPIMDPLYVAQRLGAGHFMERLAEALADVGNDVALRGEDGSVTVKFKITGDRVTRQVNFDDEIKLTPPVRRGLGAVFYAVDGGLYRDDPRQPRMPFYEVDQETGEVRDAPEPGHSVREVS